jgi:hypothetical protein
MQRLIKWFRSKFRHRNRETKSSATRRWSKLLVIYLLAISAYLNSGEILHPRSIPLSSTDVATVPLFNVWTIGWNADRALHCFRGYWDAPIFYPARNAFAFSEPQPATLLVAPIVWITGSAVIGYKAWLFLSFFLNGFFTARLLRRLGYSTFLQLVGATAIMLTPVVHQRIDVVQLVPVWGIIWFWSSLFDLAKAPGWRTTIQTGLSFATCFALCVHHSLFLSLLTPFASLVFIPLLAGRRFLFASIGALAIGCLGVLPIILPIRAAAKENEFARHEKLVQQMSATPRHYLVSPANSLISFKQFKGPNSRQFCVGWIRMSLAFIGIGYGIVVGCRRRWIVFLSITAAFAFAFSQGFNLHLGDWKPWQTLCEHLPGFGQVRSVFRFAWFVQLAVILLAVEGAAALHAVYHRWFQQAWSRTALTCLVVVPGLLLAAEIWPETPTRGGTPNTSEHAGWTQFLREHSPAGKSIACLPFATGRKVHDFDTTTRWMCCGLKHGVPMLNGYSGFFPQSYLNLQTLVNKSFPSTEVLEKFASINVGYLVVARKYCAPEKLLPSSTAQLTLTLAFEDPVGIDLYRLDKMN